MADYGWKKAASLLASKASQWIFYMEIVIIYSTNTKLVSQANQSNTPSAFVESYFQ